MGTDRRSLGGRILPSWAKVPYRIQLIGAGAAGHQLSALGSKAHRSLTSFAGRRSVSDSEAEG
jgi:hypothetical protein